MTDFNTPFKIGRLHFPHRLIQGPLAGFSAAPFRELFSLFQAPSYAVSEMTSAQDVVYKHRPDSRYLYRSPQENYLAYQIAGNDPHLMAQAAQKLQGLGADLIDINCGCPKTKIRKKGYGSSLLENTSLLLQIVNKVRAAIECPLTVKLRILNHSQDVELAQELEKCGVDALIIHPRRWQDSYEQPCNFEQFRAIRCAVNIPLIYNGDIHNSVSLHQAALQSQADAFMIARAGTGKPWLYQELLDSSFAHIRQQQKIQLFMTHLHALASLENEFKAVLQSRSLIRYYFKHHFSSAELQEFYSLTALKNIESALLNSSLLSEIPHSIVETS